MGNYGAVDREVVERAEVMEPATGRAAATGREAGMVQEGMAAGSAAAAKEVVKPVVANPGVAGQVTMAGAKMGKRPFLYRGFQLYTCTHDVM